MDIYLIRHAQSANNAMHDVQHFLPDPALTDLGHTQAKRVAQHLAAGGYGGDSPAWDALIVSPMQRALQTARHIAAALDLRPTVWVGIHEVGGMYKDPPDDGGTATGLPGMDREAVAALLPDAILPDDLTEAGWWDAARGVESNAEGADRARAAVERILALENETQDTRLIIISHGHFLDLLIRALLNQPMPDPETGKGCYYTNNTGVTQVHLSREWGNALFFHNAQEHLPLEMRTW